MASAAQISCRNLGHQSWASAPTPAGGRGTARRVVVPYGWLRRATAIALGSGAQRSVCAADGRNEEELEQKSPPEGPAPPDNPSVSLRLTAPFAHGSLWDGGCGSPRRPCGPPRNDNGFLSFRGAERRGNPFPFTMDGGSGRRVVGPYGKPNQPPMPAGAQRSVRARGREGWARIGAEAIKKGHSPATTQAALSEAESAGIVAGQIQSLSDDLFVQHGVPGSVAR